MDLNNQSIHEAQSGLVAAQVLASYLDQQTKLQQTSTQQYNRDTDEKKETDDEQNRQVQAMRNHMAHLISLSSGSLIGQQYTPSTPFSMPVASVVPMGPQQTQREFQEFPSTIQTIGPTSQFSTVTEQHQIPYRIARSQLDLTSIARSQLDLTSVHGSPHSFGPVPTNTTNKYDSSNQREHPFWLCKREGCSGMLTLLGNEKHHIKDLMNARRRASWRRAQYPATRIHGSPMSCSICGDRPMLKSRRSAWQRLCVICMEPYV
jgi:hypothetical protein